MSVESARFLTFHIPALFPAHARLVVNVDARIITLVDADGCFQEQKRIMPVQLLLAVRLLQAYPEPALTKTLLAALLNSSQEAMDDCLAEAEKKGERELQVLPLRSAIWQTRKQLSAFGLDIVPLKHIGYTLFAATNIQRRRAYISSSSRQVSA